MHRIIKRKHTFFKTFWNEKMGLTFYLLEKLFFLYILYDKPFKNKQAVKS